MVRMVKKDLNKLTFSELQKEVANLTKVKDNVKKPKGLIYCIVRTYSAGVFAGMFDRRTKGKEGTVYEARRLWKWSGALDCSQLAMKGIDNPSDCKFSNVSEVDLKEIIEVSPCTEESKKSIGGVPEWSKLA